MITPVQNQKKENEEIPYGFIEESGQMPGVSVGRNLNGQRKKTETRIRDSEAVGFHIKIIAPSAYALGQSKSGHDDITQKQGGEVS